jgi:nucleoside-diphosphate-sugar epimerase
MRVFFPKLKLDCLDSTLAFPIIVALISILLLLHGSQADGDALASCPSFLIVGASSFEGSFIFNRLQSQFNSGCKSAVVGIDVNANVHMHSIGVKLVHSTQLSDSEVASADVVFFVQPSSSSWSDCNQSCHSTLQENTDSIVALASRMSSSQLLIFATTAADAVGPRYPFHEDDRIDDSNLDV